MKSCVMLFPTIILLVFSAVSGLKDVVWYHPVGGNCRNLREVKDYEGIKVCSGSWYFQYTSCGEDGDRCVSSQAIQRGNTTFVDLLMVKPNTNSYVQFPVDLTYHPDKGGRYTDSKGALGHMGATDLKTYFFYTQCKEAEGQTVVMNMFATRDPVLSDEAKKIYEEISAKLEKQNLLAPMHQVDHTDCPPLYNLVEGKAKFD